MTSPADPNFIAPERIELPNFTIRALEPEDSIHLQEAERDSYNHLKLWMPWASPDPTLEDKVKHARRSRATYLLNENFGLEIFTPNEERFLGGTGYHVRHGYVLSDCTGEIGMWIRADAAGKGLGKQVLIAMLDWGFKTWGWEKLMWRCDTRNVASYRTAESVGMRREAHLREDKPYRDYDHGDGITRVDSYAYALLKSEWPVSK